MTFKNYINSLFGDLSDCVNAHMNVPARRIILYNISLKQRRDT
jgi:hypothetical protein